MVPSILQPPEERLLIPMLGQTEVTVKIYRILLLEHILLQSPIQRDVKQRELLLSQSPPNQLVKQVSLAMCFVLVELQEPLIFLFKVEHQRIHIVGQMARLLKTFQG